MDKITFLKVLFFIGIAIDMIGFFGVSFAVLGVINTALLLPAVGVFVSGGLIMVISRVLLVKHYKGQNNTGDNQE